MAPMRGRPLSIFHGRPRTAQEDIRYRRENFARVHTGLREVRETRQIRGLEREQIERDLDNAETALPAQSYDRNFIPDTPGHRALQTSDRWMDQVLRAIQGHEVDLDPFHLHRIQGASYYELVPPPNPLTHHSTAGAVQRGAQLHVTRTEHPEELLEKPFKAQETMLGVIQGFQFDVSPRITRSEVVEGNVRLTVTAEKHSHGRLVVELPLEIAGLSYEGSSFRIRNSTPIDQLGRLCSSNKNRCESIRSD